MLKDNLPQVKANYDWIIRIIRSAETEFQCDACENLIKNFENAHPKYIKMGSIMHDVLIYQREFINKEHEEM